MALLRYTSANGSWPAGELAAAIYETTIDPETGEDIDVMVHKPVFFGPSTGYEFPGDGTTPPSGRQYVEINLPSDQVSEISGHPDITITKASTFDAPYWGDDDWNQYSEV